MRQHLTCLLATSMLAAGGIVSGCASTAKGVQATAFAAGPETPLSQTAPTGTALAVVRYPAFIEADAEEAFAAAYAGQAIGGGQIEADPVETKALANSVVLKSNYFAMSLYRELTARLPEHSVLLSPHRIVKAADGTLTSEPMTQAETLPSVVAVDFTAYTYPDMERMMGDKPLTFGDLVTPVVTVRTDPRTSVGTEGVLLASSPVIAAAAGGNYAQAITDATALQAGRLETGVPELDIISHLSGTPRLAPETSPLRGRPAAATVRSYPIEKIRLNGEAIATVAADKADVLEAPFTDAFANQIVRLINRTDATKAAMLRRADVIADYDEGLAALTLVGSHDPAYRARLRYAERLLEAEQKYLSVQSLRLYDGIVNGEMGAQVRDMLQEEHRILERRRKLARQQNTAVALGVLSAVVAGAAIANDGSGREDCRRAQTRGQYYDCIDRNNRRSRADRGNQIATTAAIQGAIFSATEAMRRNSMSRSIGENYLQSVVPVLNAQTEVQVDLIDSSETITAIRLEDLKDKLGALYAENQRSLDTVATRCAYSGSVGPGTWMGSCANGLADGPGVGVFRNRAGNLVEHYGHARAGRADGPGYRIVRAPEGSYSIEGNFSGGAANGVARVERSGSVALRRFNNGRDMGAAPDGSVNASPFRMGDRAG
ncbi:hypothetical protein [uncultured Algimonas sp.]|uniref:hypothetical protein n=1 Tax=uncultured Algimonas sp. TaxID=1547920 RepID=UPI00260616E1|nr:hypothetical protein [uncultured Algimonas sp.]